MSETPEKSSSKFKTYLVFTKFRLSFLVILSALSGYLFAGGKDLLEITYLMLGGTLVTGASNGANQIWERNLDKIMNRTNRRPLPTGQMSLQEAYIIVVLFLIVGSYLLWLINIKSALLGLLAFGSYVFVYTPMKQVSPWAVFVGAFPGAIPPFLGAIAATNQFGFIPGILFFVQFTWQFPHFWAIAWVLYDDYKKQAFHSFLPKMAKARPQAFKSWPIHLRLSHLVSCPGYLDGPASPRSLAPVYSGFGSFTFPINCITVVKLQMRVNSCSLRLFIYRSYSSFTYLIAPIFL